MGLLPESTGVRIGQNLQLSTPKEQTSRTYRVDYAAGRVSGFVDRAEAMEQAIYKILLTERFAFRIYSWTYGMEWNAVAGKSWPVFESEIKRVIREALLADDRISDITDMTVSQIDKRTAAVSFTAQTIFGEIPIERTVDIYV